MGLKVKVTLDLPTRIKRFSSTAKRRLCSVYEVGILDSILSGKSPVRGVKNYKKYSKSYIKAIKGKTSFKYLREKGIIAPFPEKDFTFAAVGKKETPVNLKLSSEMLSSLRCVIKGQTVQISFTDKLAKVHHFGTRTAGPFGNTTIPARPMLPTKQGQLFNIKITKAVQRELDKIAKKITAP